MALSGGCFGLGLIDISESRSTKEAPSPRKLSGFLESSPAAPMELKLKLFFKLKETSQLENQGWAVYS